MQAGPRRPLTLAPFWAEVSALPSGLKTMPGSPFSPWNRVAGKGGRLGQEQALHPPSPAVNPPRHRRDSPGHRAVSGASAGPGKRPEGSPPQVPGHGPPPPEQSPGDPGRPLTLGPGRPCWPLEPRSPFGPAGPCRRHRALPGRPLPQGRDPPPRRRRPPDTPVRMGSPAPVPRPHGGPPGPLPAKQRPRARWGGTHGEACEPRPALWRERQRRSGPAAGRCTAPSPSRGRTYLGARHARQCSLSMSQQSQCPGGGRKRTTFTMNTQLP